VFGGWFGHLGIALLRPGFAVKREVFGGWAGVFGGWFGHPGTAPPVPFTSADAAHRRRCRHGWCTSLGVSNTLHAHAHAHAGVC
jgi:hypothetical protein